MARWVFNCPECQRDLPHCEISADVRIDSFLGFVAKPEFPAGGLKVECPTCKTTSLFQRYELLYRHR